MSYDLAYEQRSDFRQDAHQRVSPRLVAASSMLELSSMALQQAIDRELDENPALEADEVAVCQTCSTPLHGSICPTCLRLQRHDLPSDAEWDRSEERLELRGAGEEQFDPLMQVAGAETLGDRLLADLGTMLSRGDQPLAQQLVGSLDERGYLTCSLEEVAEQCAVPLDRVAAVLTALQSLEPVGVGARDLRECLLIQIEHLTSRGIAHPLVRTIVAEHWDELAQRKVERIARRLRCDVAEVVAALVFVREHLNPFPAHGHAGPEAIAEARSTYLMPDVAIVRTATGFDVEVIEARRLELRLSSAYRDLARAASALPDADRAHVTQYLSRARLFIQNLNQRRQTIRKVAQTIARAQGAFLTHGIRHLLPLTRSQIARDAAIDESTVSRATNGKSVLLPSGEVVSFDTFFRPALSIHDVMREILATESSPLTDGEIRASLATKGIHIARRTVAKYRGQLGVLSSLVRAEPRVA